MNRQSQAAVLFLLGAALLHAGTTDLYLRYVKAGLRPLLLAAGAILVVTALATALYERRRSRRPPAGDSAGDHAAEEGHAHGPAEGHGHREPRVSWLLVLPLLALILVAPPALGSYSATRTGTALQEPLAYPALPAEDPLPLSVVDYAGRAVYDHGRTLTGREVRLTGFVALDHDGTPYLVRMALNCCAADAQPVKVGLTGAIPPVLQPDTWLTVTGTYTPRVVHDPVNNGPIPFLKVTGAKPTATPRDPYDESWNN
ncbi:TIGR03943 family putative permease subunit [Streptomyces asoensis]|uniref:TIGR03943 family putative permease subunit n=1 Tax=Streptomyces TaxID=1883 RepID=UPI00190C1C2C|nr:MULTISPECIES: TIGR03943 family protein [unclassified Streptomyces]MBK3630143.1 TIGR03943 family protein [Streptomyces sp. MBT49]MBK3637511.1 TIGR03943 family protein [Streptomyces sp. MBT97]